MAGQLYRLASTGDWVARGRAPLGSGVWIPGVTEPSLANQFTAAANCGIRVPRASLTVVAGDVHTSGTTAWTNTEFTGRVIVDSGSPTFTDCYFSGGNQGSGQGMIICQASGVTGVVADHCHFIPDTPQAGLDAIIGHHYTVRRSIISHTQDGCGSFNSNAGATNVQNHIEGNYIYNNAWWYPDPLGVQSDGSHCDGVQHQGQNGLWVLGNSIHGYVVPQAGSDITNNPGGSAPNYNQTGQLVIVQNNTGSVDEVHINDNWVYGSANGISIRDLPTNVEVKRNKWMDNGEKVGTHINYIRCDSGTVINGVTYITGYYDMPSGPDANVWGFTGNDALGNPHTIGDPIADGIRVP